MNPKTVGKQNKNTVGKQTKQTSNMSKPLMIAPKVKIYFGETKTVTAGEYITAKAAESKLDEGIIRKALAAAYHGEEYEGPEDADKKTLKKLAEVNTALALVIKKHKKFKKAADEAAEKAKEEAKAEREREKKRKDDSIKDYTSKLGLALADKSVVKTASDIQSKMDATLTSFLPKAFKVDGNEIILEGKATKEDFAKAFAGFIKWADTTKAVGDSAAKREAQLGLLARKQFGEEWVNFFKSDRASDLSRIQKYMNSFDEAELMDKQATKKVKACAKELIMTMPLGTFRKLQENKFVTKEDGGEDWKEKNAAIKLELANIVKSHLEKSPDGLTQMQVANIVKDFKEARGIKAKQHHRYLYVLLDEDGNQSFFGSDEYDTNLLKACACVVDRNLNVFLDAGDEGVTKIEPSTMSDEQREVVNSILGIEDEDEEEEEKPAKKKKGKDKEEKPAKKKKVVEDDEDEEDDDDDEEEEVKPSEKKVAKKSSKKEEEEEEDDDDDEDSDDEDEDDEDDSDEDEDEDDSDDEDEDEDDDEDEDEDE